MYMASWCDIIITHHIEGITITGEIEWYVK